MSAKTKRKNTKNGTVKAISIDDPRLENYHNYYYYLKLNWIHSCLRSLMHCFNHRLHGKYIGKSAVLFVGTMIIAILYNNYGNINSFSCPCSSSQTASNQTASNSIDYSLFEINAEKKVNKIKTEMSMSKQKLSILENEIISLNQRYSNQDELKAELMNITLDQYKNVTDDIERIEDDISILKSMVQQLKKKTLSDISISISKMNDQINDQINSLNYDIENRIIKLESESNDISKDRIEDDIKQRLNVIEEQIENIKRYQNEEAQSSKMNPYMTVSDITNQEPDFTFRVEYHTEIMTSTWIQRMEAKLYYFLTRNYDQRAILPSFRIGDCVPLKFDQNNFIIFKLRDPDGIFINAVTYEHISINLLPNNRKQTAPKEMTLEFSVDGFLYHKYNGKLLYDPHIDGSSRYYKLDEIKREKYKFVKLRIISNHGGAWTCLYRLKVHGVFDI